jgi:esterase/lipase superfamily enzyme
MGAIGKFGARVCLGLLATLMAGCVHAPDYREWTAACAQSAEPPVSYADDRIYFVTSRLPHCRDNQTSLSHVRTDRIRYGEVVATASSVDARSRVGSPVLVAEEAWRDRLQHDLASADGRVLLYVHGYNVDFRKAARRARRLRQLSGFGGPILLFDWPSQDNGLRYGWDEENALWTQPYFDALLGSLLEESRVSDLVLVAHSMGSRILLRSLVEVDRTRGQVERDKIRTVILASPDVDRQILARDYLAVLNAGDRQSTIYVSRRDRALRLSWGVHGLARAGDSRCRFWNAFPRRRSERCFIGDEASDDPRSSIPDGIDVVDTSQVAGSGYRHSDFVDSLVAAADVCHVLQGHDSPPNRERIGTRANVYSLAPGPISCP